MKFFTKEVRIALIAIVAIVVLFVGMQFLKGMSLFSSNDVYYVAFSDVSGLSASSPVYANGYRVGVVQGIEYNYERPDHIVAAVDLDPKLRLTSGSHAEIVSDFLGNVRLELRLGPMDSPLLQRGDTIEGSMEQGLMSQASAMIPQVQALLPKLDSILTNITALTADPALANTLHNAEAISSQLTRTSQQLTRLTSQLNHELPQLTEKAGGVLTNTETLTSQLSQMDFAATMQRVDATLANVQQITAALNSRQGTAGMLLNDANLYENINATMRSLDSLLTDFKQHPRRYINVSVFGRKSD